MEDKKYRIETIDIILKQIEDNHFFDFVDRLVIGILLKDYKDLLKGKKDECKEHK